MCRTCSPVCRGYGVFAFVPNIGEGITDNDVARIEIKKSDVLIASEFFDCFDFWKLLTFRLRAFLFRKI